MKACPHCGSALIVEGTPGMERWRCHNDTCPPKLELERKRAPAEAFGTAFGLLIAVAVAVLAAFAVLAMRAAEINLLRDMGWIS